jgi:hypothetical protein
MIPEKNDFQEKYSKAEIASPSAVTLKGMANAEDGERDESARQTLEKLEQIVEANVPAWAAEELYRRSDHQFPMTISEKIQEKECRVEAFRAEIATLRKDVFTLQEAARILADDENDNKIETQNDRKKTA